MLPKNTSLFLAIMFLVTFNGCESVETPDLKPIGVQNEYLVVTDIDGNVYPTVVIGGQTWMKENLKTTRYRDGSLIANPDGGNCYDYEGDPLLINKFGRLYNWNAVNDARGIAPEGWHVPTQAEWETLIRNLGGDTVAGGKMKEFGTEYWTNSIEAGSNESGFTALPSGRFWSYQGSLCCEGCSGPIVYYLDIGYGAWFWSSTMSAYPPFPVSYSLIDGSPNIISSFVPENVGLSIRCIKD